MTASAGTSAMPVSASAAEQRRQMSVSSHLQCSRRSCRASPRRACAPRCVGRHAGKPRPPSAATCRHAASRTRSPPTAMRPRAFRPGASCRRTAPTRSTRRTACLPRRTGPRRRRRHQLGLGRRRARRPSAASMPQSTWQLALAPRVCANGTDAARRDGAIRKTKSQRLDVRDALLTRARAPTDPIASTSRHMTRRRRHLQSRLRIAHRSNGRRTERDFALAELALVHPPPRKARHIGRALTSRSTRGSRAMSRNVPSSAIDASSVRSSVAVRCRRAAVERGAPPMSREIRVVPAADSQHRPAAPARSIPRRA